MDMRGYRPRQPTSTMLKPLNYRDSSPMRKKRPERLVVHPWVLKKRKMMKRTII